MKKIIILYPHFPPGNLAGVHRPRLFAKHLSEFGWEPIILTVHEKYYEEKADWNLVKLVSNDLRIEKVNAFSVGKFRMIGDIGLRAFFQLYRKAKDLIQSEKIDFLYIPIPSFYCALLGRWLNKSTNIKYGIDYIDPWVHDFPGGENVFSRHWFSKKLAKYLEPIAIKNASLITGVADGYYADVLERNPHLKMTAVYGAMPYGGEKNDHEILDQLKIPAYLFKKNDKLQLVYAGVMLPKAYGPLEAIFKSISSNRELYEDIEFHFIGTGKALGDSCEFSIKPLAEKYELWNSLVFEYPKRIPYLDVLVHLNMSGGIFILGSTEPHYTPSKTYQGVLSAKPLFAILHQNSSAVEVVRKSNAGVVLTFNGEEGLKQIENDFLIQFKCYLSFVKEYLPGQVNMQEFEKYSARNITAQLANLLEAAIVKDEKGK